MKKRLLAAFACLCMLLTLLPAAVFAEGADEEYPTITPGSAVEYTFNPNGEGIYEVRAEFWLSLPDGVKVDTVVTKDGEELVYGEEYTVPGVGKVLCIQNNYLSQLPLDSETQLTVNLSDGQQATIKIKVPFCYTVTIVTNQPDMAWAYCEEVGRARETFYVEPGKSIILEPVCMSFCEFTSWTVDGELADMTGFLQLYPQNNMTVELNTRMLSFGLEVDKAELEFGSVAVGYDRPAAQEFTLTNTGEMPMQLSFDNLESTEVLENYEFTLISGPDDGVLEVGESTTIQVQPKADLPAGEYTETLTVTGGEISVDPQAVLSNGEEGGEEWPEIPEPATRNVTLSFTVYELCTVTFDANGHGTAPAALENVQPGTAIAAPAAPEAEGWTFLGWYREASGETAWNFDTDLVEGSMTLYAKWEQKAAPSPVPSETPAPTATPAPSATPAPTEQPAATQQPAATAAPTATAQPAASQAPQTGDSSLLVWMSLAGAAVCGLVALERLRKKG